MKEYQIKFKVISPDGQSSERGMRKFASSIPSEASIINELYSSGSVMRNQRIVIISIK